MSKKFYHDTDFDGNKVVAQAGKIALNVDGAASAASATPIVKIGSNIEIREPRYSIGIGENALRAAASGPAGTSHNSIAIGHGALAATTGNAASVAIGEAALQKLNGGRHNVVIGNQAMSQLTTGVENVAIGVSANQDEIATSRGVFVGSLSGPGGRNDPGDRAVAVGYNAKAATDSIAIGNMANADTAFAVNIGTDGNAFKFAVGNSGYGTAGQVLTVNAAGDGVEWAAGGGGGGPTVTVNTTAGQTPATNAPTNPRVGDVFINRPDGQTWIYGPDPAGGGAMIWEPVATRHPRTFFGRAGAGAPGAQTPPVVPTGNGDLYLDTSVASGTASIYEANAAGNAWSAAPPITMLPGDQFFDIANLDVHREV